MERATKRTYRLVIIATLLSTLSLAQIGQDKYYHFGAGVITEYTGNKLDFPIGTAFMVGFGKESLDYLQYGKFDTKDLLATTLGGFAVSLTIKLLDNEKNNNLIKSYRKHKRKQSRKKESWLKNVFKYSTIYGAYSQTNSIQAPQTFIVTQQNDLIETTRKHPSDMMVTYGLRKLAFFQYENRNKFYDGTEKESISKV